MINEGNSTVLREYVFVDDVVDAYLFLAENLEAGESDPDDDEEVETVHWPVAEIPGRIGELEDAKTIAGLLLYLRIG